MSICIAVRRARVSASYSTLTLFTDLFLGPSPLPSHPRAPFRASPRRAPLQSQPRAPLQASLRRAPLFKSPLAARRFSSSPRLPPPPPFSSPKTVRRLQVRVQVFNNFKIMLKSSSTSATSSILLSNDFVLESGFQRLQPPFSSPKTASSC